MKENNFSQKYEKDSKEQSSTQNPELKSQEISIQVEATPNPFAWKFILNSPLKKEGKATFRSQKEAENLPLVSSLFEISGIVQVYFFQNTLTVTHEGRLLDEDLIQQVTSVLRTRMPVHNPNFVEGGSSFQTSSPHKNTHLETSSQGQNQSQSFSKRSDLSQKELKALEEVEAILDRTVRPALQSDGGDIEVLEFKDNHVKVLYQGACGGCPSAMMGTLDAIQNILRYEMKNDQILVTPV